ncbi:hypothetical protein BD626DRAFT_565279 [Schizophyllum amplum]|uniref:F-box domain-containing protein n=1 Tax=Schizophyllum amplum TaxID=97359 RepID=A0A550CUH7_9AGAR|nr:hypothetical protein BD626DRAFT_565279 [Auriculariopsis ampla]
MPSELLELIFDRTIPPSFLIRPACTVHEEARLGAIQTKRSLPLVCRSWYLAANELLYRDIDLRSVGQVVALSESLQRAPLLSPLVRSLTLSCYVPKNQRTAYVEDAARILLNCNQLHRVAFIHTNEWCDPGHESSDQLGALKGSAYAYLPHITSLHFDDGQDADALYASDTPAETHARYTTERPAHNPPILQNFGPQLVELHLCLKNMDARCIPDITFASLDTFTCSLTTTYADMYTFSVIAQKWPMPRLRCLTASAVQPALSSLGGPYPHQHQIHSALAAFAARNGAQLRYLHIHTVWSERRGDFELDIQLTLNHCPRLEHLVLPFSIGRASIAHPTLMWVDAWDLEEIDKRENPEVAWTDLRKIKEGMVDGQNVLPNLRGVRAIDFSLLHLRDLPRIMRPDVWTGVDATFEYPGLTVRHTADRIWRVNVNPMYDVGFRPGSTRREEEKQGHDEETGWSAGDFFERGSYSLPRDEDGSSVYSSDSSWVASDKEADDEEQLTHEEILHMFRLEGKRRQQNIAASET